jgi:hypothetical protein
MPTACRLLEKTYTNGSFARRRLKFKRFLYHASSGMTQDEKIRIGMVALSGASVVMAALGVKLPILEIAFGSGMG